MMIERIESKETGLYCHIPFCASTCDFCAFYQEKPRRTDLDTYLDGMDIEFANLPKDRSFSTIFWGGGTPSLLSAKDLKRLGESMLCSINSDFEEWTVEMAPSTVKADKLSVLLDLGVTRFSLGVQSFNAHHLEQLGRLHNPSQIDTAWEHIQASRVGETNIDLMFALPHQSIEDWLADIEKVDQFKSTHVSTYCLTFEEDTALYLKLAQGALKIDTEKERAFYLKAWDLLKELGFQQYEISNFARNPSSRCRHNLNTWRMHEWVGCGPSAASQFNGRRYRNPSSLEQWSNGLKTGEQLYEDSVSLDSQILFVDSLLFGLRMNEGIHLDALRRRFSETFSLKPYRVLFEKFIAAGYLKNQGDHFTLTREGQLRCDAIGSELIKASA